MNNKNRVYFAILLLLIACFAFVYFFFLKKPNLVFIELSHPLPLSSGDSRQLTAIGIYSDKSRQDISAIVNWNSSEPGVANVDNSGFVISVSPGTTTITVTDMNTGLTAKTALKVMLAELISIKVLPDELKALPGTEMKFTAKGTYADSKTKDITDSVIWESSNTETALFKSSTSNGEVLFKTAGTATITATDPKTGITGKSFLAVSEAELVSLKIVMDSDSVPLGKSIHIKAEGTFSDNSMRDISSAVTWLSGDKTVAIVQKKKNDKTLVVSKKSGSTVITAVAPETGIKDELAVNVSKAHIVSLSIIQTNRTIPVGKTLQFSARTKYSDGSSHVLQKSVNWSSSSPSVVKFSTSSKKKGLAIAKSKGSVVITCTEPKTGIKNTTRLDVSGTNLISISITPSNPKLSLGKSLQISAKGRFTDGSVRDITNTLKWSAESPFVLAVGNMEGQKGKIASFSEGSGIITATDPASGIQGKTLLTVTPAELVSLFISPSSPMVPLGGNVQLTAKGTYTDGSSKTVTAELDWTSADPGIAEVNNIEKSKGIIKGASEGETSITAADANTGIKGKAGVRVTTASLVSISIDPSSYEIALGDKLKLSAMGSYTDSSVNDVSHLVKWTSSNTSVADISNKNGEKGALKTIAVGSASVTATYPGTDIKGEAELEIKKPVLKSIMVVPENPSVYIGKMKQLSAKGIFTDGSTKTVTEQLDWSSSDPTIASVRNTAGRKGLVTSLAVGIVDIEAVDKDTRFKGSTKFTTRVKW